MISPAEIAGLSAEIEKRLKRSKLDIPAGVSVKHCHLTKEHFKILFGASAEPKRVKDIKQPGFYAAEEMIDVQGPKGVLKKIRLVAPYRDHTQIEISVSDAMAIGIKPPVRESGEGSVPAPGWTGEQEWVGEVPFEEMPHALDEDNFLGGLKPIIDSLRLRRAKRGGYHGNHLLEDDALGRGDGDLHAQGAQGGEAGGEGAGGALLVLGVLRAADLLIILARAHLPALLAVKSHASSNLSGLMIAL